MSKLAAPAGGEYSLPWRLREGSAQHKYRISTANACFCVFLTPMVQGIFPSKKRISCIGWACFVSIPASEVGHFLRNIWSSFKYSLKKWPTSLAGIFQKSGYLMRDVVSFEGKILCTMGVKYTKKLALVMTISCLGWIKYPSNPLVGSIFILCIFPKLFVDALFIFRCPLLIMNYSSRFQRWHTYTHRGRERKRDAPYYVLLTCLGCPNSLR